MTAGEDLELGHIGLLVVWPTVARSPQAADAYRDRMAHIRDRARRSGRLLAKMDAAKVRALKGRTVCERREAIDDVAHFARWAAESRAMAVEMREKLDRWLAEDRARLVRAAEGRPTW